MLTFTNLLVHPECPIQGQCHPNSYTASNKPKSQNKALMYTVSIHEAGQ